jgi:MFS transporter, ACS family, aldohexuronate transporter
LAQKAADPLLEENLGLEAESDVVALGVPRGRAWSLACLAMLALAVTLVDRQALAALAVSVTGSLSISDVSYGWLSSAFAAAYLSGSLPAARFVQRTGPWVGLAASVGLASAAIALHGAVQGFWGLLLLRILLGLAVAPAFACAAQTIHFVFPFKDRARGIGMLYMGNSLGSALCPPLVVSLGSVFGWRRAFACVAALAVVWAPLWWLAAFVCPGRDTPASMPPPLGRLSGVRSVRVEPGLAAVLRNPASLRAALVVAASAPVTTVVLIWGAKYLVLDHGLAQDQVGRYLWLPALMFGSSSLLFGELRARSARTRARARPPRRLVSVAALLGASLAAVPWFHEPRSCIFVAGLAMMGAGGLYTLATSDLLAHTRAGTVPVATSLTTLMQCLAYIVVSPIIGRTVQRFGNYDWVLIGAGLWVLPGAAFWLLHASRRGRRRAAP